MKEKKIIFQFDDRSGVAYIHFKESLVELKPGESKKQIIFDGYESEDVKKMGIELILDIDENGKIMGIEILGKDLIPGSLKE